MSDRNVISSLICTTILVVLGILARVDSWIILTGAGLVSLCILYGEPQK